MTSIVSLEALSGVKDDGPLCYLLQVDETFILLDCGWDENFDMFYMEAVKKRIPHINAVVLSYADPAHLGALPYLVKNGLTCPIYATVPVYKMGQMFMYDWLHGHLAVEDFDLFTADDVDTTFERIQQVKYNQTVLLKGDSGLQITPLPAGHMIGGSIWRISMGDDEIVYAVDFNHKKERHLNGCVFDSIQRPHLLITDAFNAMYNQPRRKIRDEKLVTKMLGTLREGGDVLVVIDTAGRVLEIAHLLDQLWSSAEAGLVAYNLVMLSHVASSVVESAKSQIEWMSDKILKSFELGRYNPFQFRHVQLCHSHLELMRVRSPKVVLCSDLAMECGFSRELFLEWCSDTRNTIIVTGRSGERTLGSKLIHMAESQQQHGKQANRQLTLEIKRRIRLEGSELEAYRQKRKQEEQEAARVRLEATRRSARLMSELSDEDSDDEDALAEAVAEITGVKPAPTGAVPSTPAGRGVPTTPGAHDKSLLQTVPELNNYDIMLKWENQQRASFFKQNKKSFPMFPYIEEKVKWDDYGEIIRPDEYLTDAPVIVEPTPKETKMEVPEGMDMSQPPPQVPPEEKEWPTKCIKYITKLEVLCRLEFIEFEGRSDGESIKKILSQIKPKQLILVHGSAQATRHLMQYAVDNQCVAGKIFTPKLGEIVDATVESHIFQVALSDNLLSSLVFQSVKDAELSWIDAKLVKRRADSAEEEDEGMEAEDEAEVGGEIGGTADGAEVEETGDQEVPLGVRRMKSKKTADKFLLDALPSHNIPPHSAVYVNDPKLSDMKQILTNEGFQAEFSSGVLYINNVASIRRNEAGRFHVEGAAGEEYYAIRDLIYNQFAIV